MSWHLYRLLVSSTGCDVCIARWGLYAFHMCMSKQSRIYSFLQAEVEMEKFEIEEHLRCMPAVELFDFMAAKLVNLAERLDRK